MQPFRDLLKPGQWYWDQTLQDAFNHSKEHICHLIEEEVQSFVPDRHTCLATDWSKQGLGFTLLQKYCRCTLNQAPNCCPDGWR